MKEYKKAEPLYLKLLDKQRTTLGEDHPTYLESLAILADLYYETKEYKKAEPLYLKLLDKDLGEDPTSIYVGSLANLAALYYKTKEYKKAEPLYLKLLDKQLYYPGRGPSNLFGESQ